MKRPSFQFYPGDWLRATELRSCSVGARGLWIDMICLMHEGNPYGHLKVGEKVILPANLSRMVGATIEEVEGWLEELEQAGVFSRSDDGCIFSRRMVKDEATRAARAAGGHLGGNPSLLKDAGKVNLPPNLQPTPASAVASASASASASANQENPSGSSPPGPPPCPYQDLVELYHASLPTLPRVAALNDSRRASMRGRWRDVWDKRGETGKPRSSPDLLVFFADYFSVVADSEFLTGRVPSRDGRPPFVADIDWLFGPKNFLKVIEGKYSREAA